MEERPSPTSRQQPRGRWVAILTGAISLALAVGYLLLVQLLDFRGEFLPAPVEGLLG
ncbi:MAG: hypothetical protein OHK0012_14800 [Synechococcales cyanobacterium]